MTRVLGVDLGERRVGVAISDALAITAQPLKVLERGPAMLGELASIVEDEDVSEVVVGLPLQLSGEEGAAAQGARAEAEVISEFLGLPVVLWDERLTTVTAERTLIEQGVRRSKRREVVDKIAAAVMLQNYLDARKGDR